MPAPEPAGRIRLTVSELGRRLEEAYRADAAEAEQINREWEEWTAGLPPSSGASGR